MQGTRVIAFIFGYEKSDSGEPLFCFGVCFPTVRDRLYAKRKFVHSSA